MNRPAATAIATLVLAFGMEPALAASAAAGPDAPRAGMVAQQADAPEGVVLDLTLTKGQGPELKFPLRVSFGGEAAAEPTPGVTVQVTRAELVGRQVTLRIGVREGSPQVFEESLVTIDLPLNKPAKLQLGRDPARAWTLEFTPRPVPADAKAQG
jgi:hypothetical protein